MKLAEFFKNKFYPKSRIYFPKYSTPGDPIFYESDGSVKNRFVNGLLKMYPKLSQDDVLFTGISRVKHVFALSTLNYSLILPPINSSVENLFINNSARITNGTLNVNKTIQLAEFAMNNIID